MAMCEKCGKNGFVPYQMSIDPAEQKFIGPCCSELVAHVHHLQQPPAPAPIHILVPVKSSDEVEYGVEVSNKIGVRAFANYHGLQVSFERSPAQLQKWAEEQGLVEVQAR